MFRLEVNSSPCSRGFAVRLAHYPEALYLFCSLADPDSPVIRAWRIVDGHAAEVPIVG